MNKEICFDMDGTLVDLYGVEGWLEMLRSFDPTPYKIAKPLINMAVLARLLHKAQRLGYVIKVISWCSLESTEEYDLAVEQAKKEWLQAHLPSVEFDEIIITEYGVPKSTCGSGILFDDNAEVRNEWVDTAYEPSEILDILRELDKKRPPFTIISPKMI